MTATGTSADRNLITRVNKFTVATYYSTVITLSLIRFHVYKFRSINDCETVANDGEIWSC